MAGAAPRPSGPTPRPASGPPPPASPPGFLGEAGPAPVPAGLRSLLCSRQLRRALSHQAGVPREGLSQPSSLNRCTWGLPRGHPAGTLHSNRLARPVTAGPEEAGASGGPAAPASPRTFAPGPTCHPCPLWTADHRGPSRTTAQSLATSAGTQKVMALTLHLEQSRVSQTQSGLVTEAVCPQGPQLGLAGSRGPQPRNLCPQGAWTWGGPSGTGT